jgi:hypothetical protein
VTNKTGPFIWLSNLLDLYSTGYSSSQITIWHTVIFRQDTPLEVFWLPNALRCTPSILSTVPSYNSSARTPRKTPSSLVNNACLLVRYIAMNILLLLTVQLRECVYRASNGHMRHNIKGPTPHKDEGTTCSSVLCAECKEDIKKYSFTVKSSFVSIIRITQNCEPYPTIQKSNAYFFLVSCLWQWLLSNLMHSINFVTWDGLLLQ